MGKEKNKNAEQLSRIFTETTQPQVYEDSGGQQLLTLLKDHQFPTAFKKKDHEACNSNYIRHNTCFPESVSEETNEETKQGKKSEKHFGRYSS